MLKFEEETTFVRISQYLKGSVTRKFPWNYFSIAKLTERPKLPGEVGITRRTSVGNQENFLNGLCVNLPITKYDILKNSGGVAKSVSNSRKSEDCVSFRTAIPSILIELTWQSADDIDLSVLEPNGNRISFRDDKSVKTGGRLVNDQNVARCGEDSTGREQIRWIVDNKDNLEPLKGNYRVQIRHWKNCGNGPTKWNLAIIVRGKLIFRDSGVSNNKKRDSLITQTTFKFKK